MKTHTMTEAKNDICSIIREAEKGEVLITRHGKPAAVGIVGEFPESTTYVKGRRMCRDNVREGRTGVSAWALTVSVVMVISVGAFIVVWVAKSGLSVRVSIVEPGRTALDRWATVGPPGSEPRTEANGGKARAVFAVQGWLPTSMELHATLYMVRDGQVIEGTHMNALTSSSQLTGFPGFLPPHVSFRFAICETGMAISPQVTLGSAKDSAGSMGGLPLERPFDVGESRTLSGRVSRGSPEIVYVEGDSAPVVSRGMTLSEFARRNRGNYCIITLQMRSIYNRGDEANPDFGP